MELKGRLQKKKKLNDNYGAIKDTLTGIASDSEDKTQTRHEAAALVSQVSKLYKLETMTMTILWGCVLGRFKATNDQL